MFYRSRSQSVFSVGYKKFVTVSFCRQRKMARKILPSWRCWAEK
ncbi:hypothetical protein HMPREF9538_05831 [Klebsiella sp. MS 92-3]|nr:hypothetical protein HMPREF9538_05831 [Klebsiella sp. MS 92-3]